MVCFFINSINMGCYFDGGYTAETIKTFRIKLGLSQSRLSELANVSQSFISKIEAEKCSIEYKKLDRIAKVLGIFYADDIQNGYALRNIDEYDFCSIKKSIETEW